MHFDGGDLIDPGSPDENDGHNGIQHQEGDPTTRVGFLELAVNGGGRQITEQVDEHRGV
jgi:hypothetical protein